MSDWYLKGGAGLADPEGDWFLKGGKYIARRNISDHQEPTNEDDKKGE